MDRLPQEVLGHLAARARAGDGGARERLLSEGREFVRQVACAVCRRPLDWRNDDELSVGLIALNEAVDSFDPEHGVPFPAYARVVISRRLVDHFRREERHRGQVSLEDTDAAGRAFREDEGAWSRYTAEREAAERAAEVAEFARRLGEYGMDLADLVHASPKHRDTRRELIRIARVLSGDPQLLELLHRRRAVPVGELARRTGASRRVLERGRRYILALTVILEHDDMPHLCHHLRAATEEVGS